MVHQSAQSNPLSNLQQLQVANHQNCGGSVVISDAGLVSVQYARLHGEKAPRGLKSFLNACDIQHHCNVISLD